MNNVLNFGFVTSNGHVECNWEKLHTLKGHWKSDKSDSSDQINYKQCSSLAQHHASFKLFLFVKGTKWHGQGWAIWPRTDDPLRIDKRD